MYGTLTGRLLNARRSEDGGSIFGEVVQTSDYGSEVVFFWGRSDAVEALLDVPEMEDVTIDARAYVKNGDGPPKLVVQALKADIGRPRPAKS